MSLNPLTYFEIPKHYQNEPKFNGVYSKNSFSKIKDGAYIINLNDCVEVIPIAQLHLTKSELRFCVGSNPACGVLEICNGKNIWQWSWLEIRRQRLSSANHSAKAILHQHHRHDQLTQ